MRYWWVVLAAVVVMPALVPAEDKKDEKKEEKAPSYVKDVKPILEANCVRCHKGGNAKGGANLTSVESILKGGKKGRTLLSPGNPDKSPVVLTMQGKGKRMPPRKEKQQPTQDEIELVKKWIAAGAKDDSKDEKKDN